MIKDFNFYSPTQVVFGKSAEEQLAALVRRYGGTRVLVHYGGGSARRSGLLDKVFGMLSDAGIGYVEMGGVVPNPLLSKVKEGIELCRKENVDFILAVGGGSVIDSAKAIAYGVPYDGDPWDFWDGKAVPQSSLSVGVILTIPAAYTLPPYQTAAGATDIMMHTMERYFSRYDGMTLTDSIAESLLRTVKDSIFEVLKNPTDYRHRAQIMWAGSLSHNNLTECGLEKDFATHRLEHELSALFGVTHGAGLAAMWGSWARFVMPKHVSRFVQYAVNVMGVTNDLTDPEGTALRGIEATERFFHAIGMPTSIPELLGREVTDDEIALMVRKCSRGGTITLGSIEKIGTKEMETIYRMASSQPLSK